MQIEKLDMKTNSTRPILQYLEFLLNMLHELLNGLEFLAKHDTDDSLGVEYADMGINWTQ